MEAFGLEDKLFPVTKIAILADLLQEEGVPRAKVLLSTGLFEGDLASTATRVSLEQTVQCYRNAIEFAPGPFIAYRAGLRLHVPAYGMFGFAMLSSTNFRRTAQFAMKHHELSAPLADVAFKEEGGLGVWTMVPLPLPQADCALYRFITETQLGTHTSLHRDVMGASFTAKEIHLTYRPADNARSYSEIFGCPVLFEQPENRFVFDASWLDRSPALGSDITYSMAADLCDHLLEELHLSAGLQGKVRRALLVNLARPTSFEALAKHFNMTPRTLRRKLSEQDTSYRQLLDDLRMQAAIKYFRDTTLTVEEVAYSLGYSDAANFRHAFRRWTDATPDQFRSIRDGG
jgi:AraC-like DNA-binding protein